MAKKLIRQNETVEVMRSQINLNPFNPKRHADKKIEEQMVNLKKVGLLGGISWNKKTGNLLDGHRRIMAMDLHYCYDGTPATDYKVLVTAVELDEKTEKEQLTYMAMGNTKADYDLIAKYANDIDLTAAGLSDYDISQVESFMEIDYESLDGIMDDNSFDDLIYPTSAENSNNDNSDDENSFQGSDTDTGEMMLAEEKKANVKRIKAIQRENAANRYADLNAYITVSFANADEKRMFCEMLGISETEMFVKGSSVMEAFE